MTKEVKEAEAPAPAVAAPAALATTPGAALAEVPDHLLAEAGRGTESFTLDMMRIPRLSLAHGTSPQMTKSEANYISELKLGDAFNDLTGEIYGDGFIDVIVIRADKPRWMEFDEDRNIVDRNVPAGDPRTLWRKDPEDPKGKKELKPIAMMFLDFVVLVGSQLEPMALSFKSTGIDNAKRLISLLNSPKKYQGMVLPKLAIYHQKYQLKSYEEKDGKNTWYNFSIRANGLVEDPEVAAKAKKFFERFAAKIIDFEAEQPAGREPGSDDDQM